MPVNGLMLSWMKHLTLRRNTEVTNLSQTVKLHTEVQKSVQFHLQLANSCRPIGRVVDAKTNR